jgi:hypothetical protein
MYHCERTYLGSCDTGIEWGKASFVEVMQGGITPTIGQTVYLIIGNEIFEKKIYAITKNGFIAEDDGFAEHILSHYGKDWFYDLDKAKNKVLDGLDEDWEIVQGEEDWWYADKI